MNCSCGKNRPCRYAYGPMWAFLQCKKEAQMNTTRLYQIYDLKAEKAAGPIMSQGRDGPAIRSFLAILGQPDTLPGQYPQDFELRYLGTQDEETGVIAAALPPQVVATGAGWLETQRPRDKPEEGCAPFEATGDEIVEGVRKGWEQATRDLRKK